MEWTKDNTTKLIEHFKEKRELWDSTSIYFKDRQKKHDAWKELADKLNLVKDVVEKKMRSLIGQFQRELKRSRSAAGTEEYTSKWFGFQLLLFLKDKKIVRRTNEADISEDNSQETASTTQIPASPRIKRKKFHTERQSRDEFNIFGEHIACRLRKLRNPYIVSNVQHQIHNIVFQAEMEVYSGANTSYNNFRSPQTSSGLMGSPDYEDTDTSQFSDDKDDILII